MKREVNKKLRSNRGIYFVTCFLLCALIVTPSFLSEAKWEKNGKKYRYTIDTTKKKYYKNQWVKIDGKYYYFNKNGYRKSGWLKYKGENYYLNKSGIRVTGFKTINGKKYYFNKNGVMVTGWLQYNNHFYYLNQKGVLQKGLKVINDQVYYFDENGRRFAANYLVLGNLPYYFATDGTLQYTGTEEEKAVKYINIQRMLKGYNPLTYYTNCNLSSAAYVRAKELSQNASHMRMDGTDYSTVLTRDYPVAMNWCGECVSWGVTKSGNVVAQNWLNDSNSNVLLQENANGISIGIYIDENGCEYWTALVVQMK